MTDPWRAELWRILLGLAVLLLLGAVVGASVWLALAGLIAYVLWHLRNVQRLEHWLELHDGAQIPEASGIWGDVYYRLHGLRKLHDREKEQLRRSIDKYEQATRAMPNAAITLGRHWEIEMINKAATRLLGLRDPEDIGQSIKNLLRSPIFVNYCDSGEFFEPLEITSPVNGAITLSIRIVPYGESKKLLLARDVSRIKKLEALRREFVANVSHELKSPLTVIKGYVEALKEDEAIPEHWEKPVAQIDEQTERMSRIVDDLLQLSALETEVPGRSPIAVDVASVVRAIHGEALQLSGHRHEVIVETAEQVDLLGNYAELRSAFSNLVSNAIRYTPNGGSVRLRWWRDESGRARFSVADDGLGIPREHIPRLTERFFRVDQARSRAMGGTGLGLAIVKHVLMRHDARLEIDSELGRGSTFTCVFPAERVLDRRAGTSTAE